MITQRGMIMIDSNETVMYKNGYKNGYSEGYIDGLNTKIETIKPHPTEAIVLCINKELGFCRIQRIFNMVKHIFPNNIVIALPDKCTLESDSKDVLENYISMISEIIEKL